eukprot:6191728-Pleurochrysis_carterae.AAC.1
MNSHHYQQAMILTAGMTKIHHQQSIRKPPLSMLTTASLRAQTAPAKTAPVPRLARAPPQAPIQATARLLAFVQLYADKVHPQHV